MLFLEAGPAMDGILQQLPNGGAVVALIAVVILFIRHQEHRDDKNDAIAIRFAEEVADARREFVAEIAATRKEYLDHLARITAPKPPRNP